FHGARLFRPCTRTTDERIWRIRPSGTSFRQSLTRILRPVEPVGWSFSQFQVEADMDHVREHRSVLASAEKRLLIALAQRLPGWLSSDHLTILGLVAMPAAGLAFAAIPITPWAAALFAAALAVNWFGD